MKKFFKQLGKALCYFLLYFGVQNIIGVIYMMIYMVGAFVEQMSKMNITSDMDLAAIESMLDVESVVMGAVEYLYRKQNGLVIISTIITILFLVIFFLIRKKNILTETAVKKTGGKYILLAGGLGLSCMLVINFALSLLPESWLMAYSEQSNMLVEGSALAIIISTMVMAPLIEELIFRGLMLSRLRKGMSDRAAVLICALIFGVAHGQILWMVYTFALGIVLGLVAVKSDSVVPGIVLHMVFNICGVVVPTLLGESITVEICVVMLAVGVVLTVGLLRMLLKQKNAENDSLETI